METLKIILVVGGILFLELWFIWSRIKKETRINEEIKQMDKEILKQIDNVDGDEGDFLL